MLSFSKPQNNEPDQLGYEVVGQYPNIKIYSDKLEKPEEGSSGDGKIVSMLKTPSKEDKHTCDESTYEASQVHEYKHKRQQSYCQNNFNKRRLSKKRPKSHQNNGKKRHSKSRRETQEFKNSDVHIPMTTSGNRDTIDMSKHTNDKSLNTLQVMQIMNNQIQSVRDEFMGAIKGISDTIKQKNVPPPSQVQANLSHSGQSKFETVNQLNNGTQEYFYSPDADYPYPNESEYISTGRAFNNPQQFYTSRDHMKTPYAHPNLQNLDQSSTDSNINRIQPFSKSKSTKILDTSSKNEA